VERVTGFEPATFSLARKRSSQLNYTRVFYEKATKSFLLIAHLSFKECCSPGSTRPVLAARLFDFQELNLLTSKLLEAWAGIAPAHRGFADLCLTTWLPRHFS
jgi:hypothetical protein